MCGFIGEYRFSDALLSTEEDFASLVKLSKRRGPDHTAIVKDANYQLGLIYKEKFKEYELAKSKFQNLLELKVPFGYFYLLFINYKCGHKDFSIFKEQKCQNFLFYIELYST
mgnify:CR=1 FL=1